MPASARSGTPAPAFLHALRNDSDCAAARAAARAGTAEDNGDAERERRQPGTAGIHLDNARVCRREPRSGSAGGRYAGNWDHGKSTNAEGHADHADRSGGRRSAIGCHDYSRVVDHVGRERRRIRTGSAEPGVGAARCVMDRLGHQKRRAELRVPEPLDASAGDVQRHVRLHDEHAVNQGSGFRVQRLRPARGAEPPSARERGWAASAWSFRVKLRRAPPKPGRRRGPANSKE